MTINNAKVDNEYTKARDAANPLPDHMTKGFKGSQWKQGADWSRQFHLDKDYQFALHRAWVSKYKKAVDALNKANDQMQYYSCELIDNPSSWNEVIAETKQTLKELGEHFSNDPYGDKMVEG